MSEDSSRRARRSRSKGSNFERWVAKELREIWPEAKRGFQTRGGTAEEPDVKNCGPFAIECKAHKKVDREAAFTQMANNANGFVPIAITKDDRQGPVVSMSFSDAYGMFGEYHLGALRIEIPFGWFKQACQHEFGKQETAAMHTGEKHDS